MKFTDFRIGDVFICGERRFRCTDIGTRIISAIPLDAIEVTRHDGDTQSTRILSEAEAQAEGWFNGPPYAVQEIVFDEDDQQGCQICH